MGSDYTDNNKFEKIGTGEQAGTWGTTTNLNFDMIDRAINGVTSIGLTGTTSTITTSDGTLTDGLFKVLQFTGSLSAGHTVTIAPNSVEKLYFINNTSGNTLTFIQGTGGTVGNGRAVAIENNKTGIIFCDGSGDDATAKVQKIETGSDEFTEDVTIKTDDGALLTLQTGDTTVTDGDVLGALQFQAPSETDGDGDATSDSRSVAAAIVAEADDTFDDDSAATDLVFKLGTTVAGDDTAIEKMRLTHEGDLNLVTDGKSINFGADSEIQLTHHADTGLKIKHNTNGDDKFPTLTLQTGDQDIAEDDVLGRISFQAPDETEGTDAQLSAVNIEAVSEGNFSASNNATSLVINTTHHQTSGNGAKYSFSANGSFEVKTEETGDGENPVIMLLNGDTNIEINDTIGFIGFQAPDETSASGDNKLVCAGIAALSEGDFSGTNNATKLSFRTAASETATEKMALSSAGALTVTGDITAFSSDERLKNFEGTILSPLEKIQKLNGYTFTWNDKAKELDKHLFKDQKEVGVSAQEVQAVCPEVVKPAPFNKDYLTVQYEKLVPLLIEAIKEQQKQIDELKKDK